MPECLETTALEDVVAAMQHRGESCRDPLRFHFIATLSQRASQQQGELRRKLEGRLQRALADYQARYAPAETTTLTQPVESAREVKAVTMSEAGAAADNSVSHLSELLRYIEQQSPESSLVASAVSSGARSELKAMRYFENTWAQLSVDRQVARAIETVPENAGPLNSHLLLLRSLSLMRDVSPDYLKRFMAYADGLLWLDQAEKNGRMNLKKPVPSRVVKK